ncbi:hypothetical protein ACHHYP_20251 [Achlya hypogyna]|uniref:Reverse transcriptase zinc-binding domain-containing protein n=1 Tax=Achlya hypogyna TaxID=1202772 RepID=A0A1V9YV00_ACHHY|nr:hypothetical protein ACHHYP_20251 [Achlya hypogyna]
MDAAASLRRPQHALPHTATSCTIQLKASLHHLPRNDRDCVFCGGLETHEHIILECPFTLNVWAVFAPLLTSLHMLLPSTMVGFLLRPPPPSTRRSPTPGREKLWPIIMLACATRCGFPATTLFSALPSRRHRHSRRN